MRKTNKINAGEIEEPPLLGPKKLSFLAQVALIFFTVSGGAYGLEALVGAVGSRCAIILVVLLPIFWAIPISLMVAELSSALPEQGGYYVWVKRGLGRFWGFQEGWWTLCYSAVDLALYPVLFVTYLSFFFPFLNIQEPKFQLLRWLICSAFILMALLFNLKGILAVGKNAFFNLLIVSVPFLILVGFGVFSGSWTLLIHSLTQSSQPIDSSKLAAGLAIILWNYCGWDNVSTYANEVENPQKNCPRSLGLALIIIILSYVFPLLAGFKVTATPSDWGNSSGWPSIAEMLGGHWLGVFVALVAILSAWALFNTQLLYISRLPMAMARDRFLPKVMTKTTQLGVPVVALSSMAFIAAIFSSLSFNKLIVVDILFYSLGLMLEFLALIELRVKEPELVRPFKIPLNVFGLMILGFIPCLLAVIVAVYSTQGQGSFEQVRIVGLGIVFGVFIYYVQKHQKTIGLFFHWLWFKSRKLTHLK
jgi:amino acid transporter